MNLEKLVEMRKEALKYIDEMYLIYNQDFFDEQIKFLWITETIIGVFNDDKDKYIVFKNNHSLNIRMITHYLIKLHKFLDKCEKDGFICGEMFCESPLNNYFFTLFMIKFGDNFDYVYDYVEDLLINKNMDEEKILVEVTDYYLDLLNKNKTT
jgi:hypothetical protein